MRLFISLLVPLTVFAAVPASAGPEGQMTLVLNVSTAARWFDPAESEALITPFIFYFMIHDALVKPLPGNPMAPSLAESWSTSADGLTYEFVLRRGVRFHNGEPVTPEDVKFSFERYKGASAKLLKERVAAVEIVDPHRVRFRLSRPWLDFMTFYGTPATGAAWIVPKKYVEKVGDDGCKTPSVRTLVVRSVPDDSTRLAMLKRGEADIVYNFRGPLAEEVRRTPGLTLKPFYIPLPFWYVFTEQWDPRSPWADRRVRLAANLAIDRPAINQAETLGFSKLTASMIPQSFEGYWPAPLYPYDPQRAKQLLAEAGYPNGFDASTISVDLANASFAEAVAGYWAAVGIRATLRPLERAAFFKEYSEKRLKSVVQSTSAAMGNAGTRLDTFVAGGGLFTYGTYPDIEGLIREQATELDRGKRDAIRHRIQQLIHDKTMYAPLMEPAILAGYGPRVAESAIGLITNMAASAPYEELRLKGK
jgi:peptide/nickel transport system substrate-binding protein